MNRYWTILHIPGVIRLFFAPFKQRSLVYPRPYLIRAEGNASFGFGYFFGHTGAFDTLDCR